MCYVCGLSLLTGTEILHTVIALSHNRRVVLRDERTGHFLYGADYSTANGGFIGFIVFDKLMSYDNKCNMDAINTEM